MRKKKQIKTKKVNTPNFKSKSLPAINGKETHKKWVHQYKDNCKKNGKIYGNKIVSKYLLY